MSRLAPVNRIIPFSNVDGPGNRTAVFFQGCPFNCLFCLSFSISLFLTR